MADYPIGDEIRKIAENFGRHVSEEYNLYALYLFGSYAKGDFREDSDIDLAVVADGFSGDLQADTLKLMRIRRSIDYRIEPHPFTVEDFQSANPLALEVMQTGMRIM